MNSDVSRRGVLAAGPAIGGAALAAAANAAPAKTLDLSDPKVRAHTRAKIMGSVAAETVYKFYRLHIYGYMNEGNLIPFFTLNNINATQWTPLPDGTFRAKTFETGVYCKFDTDEPLDTWVNPVTGATRDVWQFLGGPFLTDVSADGMKTTGAELQPEAPGMEIMGDTVFIRTAASAKWPNPMKPSVWPTQSAGDMAYWESHSTTSARVEDVLNPRLKAAPISGHFQNMATFHPWMGMGARPGRTYGKAHGAKFMALNQIPAGALKSFEQKTPQVFDLQAWTKPVMDVPSWMAAHTPG